MINAKLYLYTYDKETSKEFPVKLYLTEEIQFLTKSEICRAPDLKL